MEIPEGILLVDKPVGITSFGLIRRLQRKYQIDLSVDTLKMGHAGTLDPLASGLMIIGVGKGTKKLTEYVKLQKEYIAEILVGEQRSTGDMEGVVLKEKDVVTPPTEDTIKNILKEMTQVLSLPVSAYSAIKKDGVPMYKRARKAEKTGEIVTDLPFRNMHVVEAEYFGHTCTDGRCVVRVRFFVGSGTYIRSLAEEFGTRLGYPATLKSLRRTKVGDFRIEDAEVL